MASTNTLPTRSQRIKEEKEEEEGQGEEEEEEEKQEENVAKGESVKLWVWEEEGGGVERRRRNTSAGRRGVRGRRRGKRSISRCEERERERVGESERRHDEGFTGEVMPAGLRNFGVSELAEESYLNEAG